MDLALVKRKFEQSISTYDANAIAQQSIASTLFEIIQNYYSLLPDKILEVGSGTGLLTRKIISVFTSGEYFLNDINERIVELMPDLFGERSYTFIAGDAQQIIYPNDIDLAVSSSALQWLTNLPVFLSTLSKVMSDRGYLFFSTFGTSNLHEIKEIAGDGLRYHSMQTLQAFLEVHFEVLHVREEKIVLHFNTPQEVLRHLSATGVNGGFSRLWTKNILHCFCDEYESKFSDKQGVSLSYHPIYFAVRKK